MSASLRSRPKFVFAANRRVVPTTDIDGSAIGANRFAHDPAYRSAHAGYLLMRRSKQPLLFDHLVGAD